MLHSLTRIAFLAGLTGRVIAQTYGDPNDDPFYFPSNLQNYNPGDIINQRTVTTIINAPGSVSYQILFRTTGNNGEPSSSVATVWAPFTAASPPQVFAYQFAEDADNLDCSPSFAWANSSSKAQSAERVFQGPIVIPWALDRGYYVVSTDAEGPLSAWLVGNIEGQAVLDAIRATITHYNLGTSNTRVGLYGYSGAAHTTVWASTLAKTYAKELNIVGAAFGGTPIDLGAAFVTLNGTVNSLLAGAALTGLANAYPAWNTRFNSLLTTAGKTIRDNLRARNNCTNNTANTKLDYNTVLPTPQKDILQDSVLAAVLKRETLLNGSTTPVPTFPRLQYHGTSDEYVPYGPEQTYVNQQCASGGSNLPLLFVPFQGTNHETTAILGLPGALIYLSNLLAGGTAPSGTCGNTQSMPTPGSQPSINILGQNRDQQLQNALSNGVSTVFNA